VEIHLLGPLEVVSNGRLLELGAGRHRAVLAILALHANQVVSTDRLIDYLWGERAPPTAPKGLQNLISRLRKALDPEESGVLRTQPPGYVLSVHGDGIDARRFERLAAEGRAALETDPTLAAARLREALGLWRGDALAEFTYEPFAQAEIARLEQLRLAALEDRVDADLALGRHADVAPELRALAAANPTRERLCGQLMLALYRTGQQAEALEVFRERARKLDDELGLEPSAELRRLEQAILTQDPSLGPAPKPRRPSRAPGRRVRLGVGIVTALALAAVAVAVLVLARNTDAGAVVEPNSLVKIDPTTNEIVDVLRIGRDPGQVAIVGNYLFVTSQRDQTLHRVDLRSGEVAVSGAYAAGRALAGAGRFLWVVSEKRAEVVQIDVDSLLPLQRIPLRQGLTHAFVAIGGGSLWTSEYGPGTVSRYRLRTLQLEQRLPLGSPDFAVPVEIIYADAAAWVGLGLWNELLRIDDLTGLTTRIPIGSGPSGLVFGFGSIWTASVVDGAVWRVNPNNERTMAIVRAGRVAFGLAVGAGSVWVTNHCEGSVSRIDPRTNSVVATIETGYFPKWLAIGRGFGWVGVAGSEVAGSCD
jgi:YVTN family beta-propeller protein